MLSESRVYSLYSGSSVKACQAQLYIKGDFFFSHHNLFAGLGVNYELCEKVVGLQNFSSGDVTSLERSV